MKLGWAIVIAATMLGFAAGPAASQSPWPQAQPAQSAAQSPWPQAQPAQPAAQSPWPQQQGKSVV